MMKSGICDENRKRTLEGITLAENRYFPVSCHVRSIAGQHIVVMAWPMFPGTACGKSSSRPVLVLYCSSYRKFMKKNWSPLSWRCMSCRGKSPWLTTEPAKVVRYVTDNRHCPDHPVSLLWQLLLLDKARSFPRVTVCRGSFVYGLYTSNREEIVTAGITSHLGYICHRVSSWDLILPLPEWEGLNDEN